MPAVVRSATILGLDALPLDVEVDVLSGLPSITIVGLPDAAVKEAKERITAALVNSGFEPPRHRTIVNLAPTHIRKEGAHLDLPIALAYLLASGQCAADVSHLLIVGGLGLDGTLRATLGVLAIADFARTHGAPTLVVPAGNAKEARLLAHGVVAPTTLRSLVDHLEQREPLPVLSQEHRLENTTPFSSSTDFAHIAGQEHAKRALEIAAAGGHNVLLHGPPGSGKTLLARAMPGILPPLSSEEAFEVTKILSVRGMLSQEHALVSARPFRAPHHSSSAISLIGGGTTPQPGEVTLAHRGVLFLDEFAEFPRIVLDHLRQPLEDGEVVISRAAGSSRFPARFILLAAMNPCPCGFAGDPRSECICSPGAIVRYQQRVSGPILDRIDLHVHVPSMPATIVLDAVSAESSDAVRSRILGARAAQDERFGASKLNAAMVSTDVHQWCGLPPDARTLLERAAQTLRLSARALHRTLKVARTIADLAHEDHIHAVHIAEALTYRTPLSAS